MGGHRRDDRRGARDARRSRSCPRTCSERCSRAARTSIGARIRRPQRELVKALGPRSTGSASPDAAQKAVWAALAVRDDDAPIITDRKGNPEPDPDLRDNENVPLPAVPVSFDEDPTERLATLEYRTAVDDYMRGRGPARTSPTPGSTTTKTKIGYEIPLTRHFYKYVPPRPLAEIDAEIKALEDEIQTLLARGHRVSDALRRFGSIVAQSTSASRPRRRDGSPMRLTRSRRPSRRQCTRSTGRLIDETRPTTCEQLPASRSAGDVVVNRMLGVRRAPSACQRIDEASSAPTTVVRTHRADSTSLRTVLRTSHAWSAQYAARSTADSRAPRPSTLGSTMRSLGDPDPAAAARDQRAIADYLDRETARIDALIAAKRRMVELLEERRRRGRRATVDDG